MIYLYAIIFSYLIGSIPFGYILTKYFLKKDIRKEGSGNIGATNVLRAGNKKLALFTLILDAVKVILPLLIISKIYSDNEILIYISGLSGIIGHIFPIWLGFKGGKGVASSFALVVMLTPLTGLMTLLLWLSVFLLTRISSLASILSLLCLPIIVFLQTLKIELTFFYVMIAIIVIIKHKENIKRIIQNKESKIKF